MANYIIRRLLIMIPTLFGITIMVFCIARFAPGRPGTGAFGEGGQMDAEGQKKMREWYEKRYGLNLPFYKQYLRWWRGLFISDNEAKAWTSDYSQIYTYRLPEVEYYTFDQNTSQWYVITDIEFDPDNMILQTDPDFRNIAESPGKLIPLLDVDPAFPIPGHIIAKKTEYKPIDPLPIELLKSGTAVHKIQVTAKGWTSTGEALYIHPDEIGKDKPQRFLFKRGKDWYEQITTKPEDTWSVIGQDDPSFKAKVQRKTYKNLPEITDGRPIPRHVIIPGTPKILDQTFDVNSLTEMNTKTEASLEAWLWADNGWQIFTAKEPPATKIYQAKGDGQWYRLIGDNLLSEPSYTAYKQTDQNFLSGLADEQVADLPELQEGQGIYRHVVMTGNSIPLEHTPTEREIRRYSHTIQIFDVPLGQSLTYHTTVRAQIQSRILITLGINLLAFPIIYIIAIPMGMLMALKRGKVFDHGSNVVMLALWSIPYVLTATLAIGYLAKGGNGFDWFPTGGLKSVNYDQLPTLVAKLSDRTWHLILPIACIVYGGFAYLAKQMRAAMLENFTMDYVRTARAKGVSMRNIVLVHVLRNSLIPIVTIFATILPALIAGSVILEKIFNIEGMGMLAFKAVTNRDYDVVQSLALIFGILNLTSLLIADITYAIVDPRIAYK